MHTKTFAENIKAGPKDGLPEGVVTAIVSVYDVVDHDGDRVMTGAFDEFAKAFEDGTANLPVVWQHQLNDPDLYIGKVTKLDPDADAGDGRKGLQATIELDMDHPKAARAYKLLDQRYVSQWSHRWDGTITKAENGVNNLTRLRLAEISPVLAGANELTRTTSTKERGQKSYVDIDVPGSFEATQSAISDALEAKYPSPATPGQYLHAAIVATLPDRVCYQVCSSDPDQDDQLYWADYATSDDGSVELGDPEQATATLKARGEKAISDMPVASADHAWDSAAADKRVRDWAGATSRPNSKYAQAFAYQDGDGSRFGDYHLPFADVINGKLTIIPRAVYAAAAAVQGARGARGYPSAVKTKLGSLYSRIASELNDDSITPPWQKSASPRSDLELLAAASAPLD